MIPKKENFSSFIFPLLVIAIIVVMIGCKSAETMSKSEEMMAEETSPMVQEMITALPVPAAAYGSTPIDQEKGYLVEKLGEGLYYVTEGMYHVMFLTTGKGVIVVDAPPTIGDKVLSAIAEVTDESITHVIYSHSHADHIAAASMYPPDAVYIAHEETAKRLSGQEGGSRLAPFGAFVGGGPVPVPTVTFSDNYVLEVGTQKLELSYRGVNHIPGNIYIYAPMQKVLMFIDVVFPGWTPFKYLAITENVPGYIAAHDEILTFDFETLISGHLTRLGTRADVETQKEYMDDLVGNAAHALQTVDFMAVAERTGWANPWLLFDTYLNEAADMCTDSTMVKWSTRLGGVDIFTWGHCWKMAEMLRVD